MKGFGSLCLGPGDWGVEFLGAAHRAADGGWREDHANGQSGTGAQRRFSETVTDLSSW